jgi:hypothetical protein
MRRGARRKSGEDRSSCALNQSGIIRTRSRGGRMRPSFHVRSSILRDRRATVLPGSIARPRTPQFSEPDWSPKRRRPRLDDLTNARDKHPTELVPKSGCAMSHRRAGWEPSQPARRGFSTSASQLRDYWRRRAQKQNAFRPYWLAKMRLPFRVTYGVQIHTHSSPGRSGRHSVGIGPPVQCGL